MKLTAGLPTVAIESPFAGRWWWNRWANVRYARQCLLDCIERGEAPIASHLLYTQVLDDSIPSHRLLGIAAGLAWNLHADCIAVYVDRGISAGMRAGVEFAIGCGIPVQLRSLYAHGQLEVAKIGWSRALALAEAGELVWTIQNGERHPYAG